MSTTKVSKLAAAKREIRKRTEEELNQEFGSKRWDGRYVELDDGTEELVAVIKPTRETFQFIKKMVAEGKQEEANKALVITACITHTAEELNKLYEIDLFLEAKLSTKAVELAEASGRDVKKE